MKINYHKEYYLKNKKKILISQKKYKKSSKSIIQHNRKKYFSLPKNRIARNLMQRLKRVAYDKGYFYPYCVCVQFGCSRDELISHIEKQFVEGMTWSNYTILWELDHIKPLCSFDLSNLETGALVNHYTNIRPLLKKENKEKHNTEDKSFWIKRCYNPNKRKSISVNVLK